jgi:8-oxo-dGTP pyrophosphatase MutT (NUDIX family)
MIDDAKTFVGAAANELFEETGLTISQHELKDTTKLALKDAKGWSHSPSQPCYQTVWLSSAIHNPHGCFESGFCPRGR